MKKIFALSVLLMSSIVLCLAGTKDSIPPLLKFDNGKEITTIKQWKKRRKEILEIFKQEMYGIAPPVPKKVKYSVECVSSNEFSGKATKKRLNLYLDNYSHPIELLIYYPNKVKKAPAFVGYNFWGNYTVIADKEIPLTNRWVTNVGPIKNNMANEQLRGVRNGRWPIEKIIDAGYALVTLYYGDVEPDHMEGRKDGVRALYPQAAYTWGAISAWAWGLSCVMNYLEKDERINARQVAVVGHSRLGKTALWTGATDPRFAMTVSNCSGCTGAALSRRKVGERFDIVIRVRPYWYSPRFFKYSGREEELAVDQHQLIALMAPRLVYVASGSLDRYADPEGEFLSLLYGSEVYPLYHLKSLGITEMPKVNTPHFSDHVAYHLREGKHDITAYDWEQYLRFANLHFKK